MGHLDGTHHDDCLAWESGYCTCDLHAEIEQLRAAITLAGELHEEDGRVIGELRDEIERLRAALDEVPCTCLPYAGDPSVPDVRLCPRCAGFRETDQGELQ